MSVAVDLKQVARKYAMKRRQLAHDAAGQCLDDGVSYGTDVCGSVEQACSLLAYFLRPYLGGVVAGYMPIRSEIDPRPAMQKLENGLGLSGPSAAPCRLALPVVEALGQPLRFDLWASDAPLQDGAYGAQIPAVSEPVCPDVLIVPLVAFNRAGHRLGYGGGYYDRTLAQLRQTQDVFAVGLAYAGQEMSDFPVSPTDVPLDAIVTDVEIMTF